MANWENCPSWKWVMVGGNRITIKDAAAKRRGEILLRATNMMIGMRMATWLRATGWQQRENRSSPTGKKHRGPYAATQDFPVQIIIPVDMDFDLKRANAQVPRD
jgi:hypothetical protein